MATGLPKALAPVPLEEESGWKPNAAVEWKFQRGFVFNHFY